MNTLLSTLEDQAGGTSTTRVVLLLLIIGVLAPWIYVSIATQKLQPLPESVVTLVGMALAAKVAQRPMEKTEPTKPQ